jgi:Putative metal-binding motif
MRFRSLVLVLFGVIAAPSFGADYAYTASTVAKPTRQGAVVASKITWNCNASGCTAKGPWAVPGVGACRALAVLVGPIRSYGHPGKQLSAAELDICNRGLAGATGQPASASQPAPAKPSISTPRPAASNSVAAQPALRGAQLQQGIKLRSDNYATLARVRAKAIAEAERQRIAANTVGGNDCNDLRADVHPGAAEICDGFDNNCDGEVDERQTIRRYLDADGDGHGDAARGLDVCPADITGYARSAETTGSPWLVEIGNDCDDKNPDIWRGCP